MFETGQSKCFKGLYTLACRLYMPDTLKLARDEMSALLEADGLIKIVAVDGFNLPFRYIELFEAKRRGRSRSVVYREAFARYETMRIKRNEEFELVRQKSQAPKLPVDVAQKQLKRFRKRPID